MNQALNILVVNYEYPPVGGGGGVICRDIAEQHVNMGNNVTVVTSAYGNLTGEENVNGVRVIRVPVLFRKKQNTASIISMLSFYPKSISKILKLLKIEKFDIINTHFAIPSGPTGNYISRKFNIPNVLSIHGGDIFDPSKALSPHKTFGLKQTVRKMLNSADKVVAQSSDTKNNAKNYYGVERNIDTIPLGINPLTKYNISKSDLGLSDEQFVFSTIGRLVRRKNIEDLLLIFKEINKKFSSRLLIMGDGPERDNIDVKIKELNLSDNVMLLGRVSDEEKMKYLSITDLYLSTAIHEGFGIVFLEAMDYGIPVVCYDRGGQVDFLQNNKTGHLIKLYDKKSFTEKVIDLLGNEGNRHQMEIFNKEYIQNYYIDNIAKQYLELYLSLINNK